MNSEKALKNICDGKKLHDEYYRVYGIVDDEDTKKYFGTDKLIYMQGKSEGDIYTFEEFLSIDIKFEIAFCVCRIPLIYSALNTRCKRCNLDLKELLE